MTRLLPIGLIAVVPLLLPPANADPETADSAAVRARDKRVLSTIQVFVGGWRGVGSPGRRGQTEDAWLEEAQWWWDFTGPRTALAFEAPKTRFYASGRIEVVTVEDTAGDEDREGTAANAVFRFTGVRPDSRAQETFEGRVEEDGRLVLDATDAAPPHRAGEGHEAVGRIELRTVARGDRLLIRYFRPSTSGRYDQLALVGYTRRGSGFGGSGVARECVVTGGEADRQVEYQGKTYYVCCKGCLEAFKEDPEKTLREYREKKAKEKRDRQ